MSNIADKPADKSEDEVEDILTTEEQQKIDSIQKVSLVQTKKDESTPVEQKHFSIWSVLNVNPIINIDRRRIGDFTFEQLTPSNTWTILHNLGFIPGNELTTNLNGAEIEGVTEVVNVNTIKITFSEPVAGYAYLS